MTVRDGTEREDDATGRGESVDYVSRSFTAEGGEMDWIAFLRRMAVIIDTDATPSQVGPTSAELRDLADEIERLQEEAADG